MSEGGQVFARGDQGCPRRGLPPFLRRPGGGPALLHRHGPRQRPDMAFSRFLNQALAGQSLTVLGDGRGREFTYVDDVVSGTVAAGEHGRPGAVYNFGGGDPMGRKVALDIIEELVGRSLTFDRRRAQVGEARTTACDGSLAQRELGFEPTTVVRDRIAAQLEWLLRNHLSRSTAALAVPRDGPHLFYRGAKRTIDRSWHRAPWWSSRP
jgi:hypothetical protein